MQVRKYADFDLFGVGTCQNKSRDSLKLTEDVKYTIKMISSLIKY